VPAPQREAPGVWAQADAPLQGVVAMAVGPFSLSPLLQSRRRTAPHTHPPRTTLGCFSHNTIEGTTTHNTLYLYNFNRLGQPHAATQK
jgi:hypothetical protein